MEIFHTESYLLTIFFFSMNCVEILGILLTVILSTALVFAELSLELGVDVTHKCRPVITKGFLIEDRDGPRPDEIPPTDIELSSLSFHLQNVKFVEGTDFSHVATGFPREITNELCVSCLPEPSEENTIAEKCKIEQPIEIYEGFLGIKRTESAYATVAYEIIQVDQDGKNTTYRGEGRLDEKYSEAFFCNTLHPRDSWERGDRFRCCLLLGI